MEAHQKQQVGWTEPKPAGRKPERLVMSGGWGFQQDRQHMDVTFPIPAPARAMLLIRPGMALLVDLPTFEDKLWLPLLADGKHERDSDPILGYLLLRRCVTQRSGLTTYTVAAMRPPHDPPPNPAAFRTLFQWPSPEGCAALLRHESALRG